MLIKRLLSVLFLALLAGTPLLANSLAREPSPDWVVPQQIPDPRPERLRQIEDGIYYLLQDQQYRRKSPDTAVYFFRLAYKVVERVGLEEAASLSFSFDPTHEEIAVNAIHIIREGEVIDLTERAVFTTIRREEDLEYGLLDGVLTAHANLKDVRVGDVILTEVTYTTRDLIAPGHISESFQPFYYDPLGRRHFRVIWPDGLPVSIRQMQKGLDPEITETPDGKAYTWIIDDAEPIPFEEDAPGWFEQWGGVRMSSMTSWGEVVDSVVSHYELDANALTSEFAAEVDLIARQTSDRPEQIVKALQLVQDRIRYVGIEIGVGGFIPRPPATVIERGFGDCKDKTLLLVASLRRLGFDAAAALVDLDAGHALHHRPPSPYAFGHVIVHVVDGDREWWLDPTDSYQGGSGFDVSMAEYGYALPLRPGQSDLVRMPERPLHAPTIQVIETFDFNAPHGGISLNVKSEYTGKSADFRRLRNADTSINTTARNYLEYYSRYYPGIQESSRLSIEDDRRANRITMIESYAIPKDAFYGADLEKSFPVRAGTITDVLAEPYTVNRRSPIHQPHTLHSRHSVVLKHAPTEIEPPDDFNFAGRYFVANSSSWRKNDEIGVGWTLRTKTHEVPAVDATDYVEDVKKFEDQISWWYDLRPEEPKNEAVKKEGSFLRDFLELLAR